MISSKFTKLLSQAQIDKEQNLLAMAEYQEKEILKLLVKIKKTEKDTNLLDYYY